jgi:hypothetical protein
MRSDFTSESKLELLVSLQADPHDLTVTTGQSYGVGHSSLSPVLQPISGASFYMKVSSELHACLIPNCQLRTGKLQTPRR